MKIKTVKSLAKELCKKEGLKKQVNIAQMTEIISVLSDYFFQETMPCTKSVAKTISTYTIECTYSLLMVNGAKRFLKAKKKP